MSKTDEQLEIEYLKSLTYTDINIMFKKLRGMMQELDSEDSKRKLLTAYSGQLTEDLGIDFDDEEEYINRFLDKL